MELQATNSKLKCDSRVTVDREKDDAQRYLTFAPPIKSSP